MTYFASSNPKDLLHTFQCDDGELYIPRILAKNLETINIVEEDTNTTNNNTTKIPFDKNTVALYIAFFFLIPVRYMEENIKNILNREITNDDIVKVISIGKYMGTTDFSVLNNFVVEEKIPFKAFLMSRAKSIKDKEEYQNSHKYILDYMNEIKTNKDLAEDVQQKLTELENKIVKKFNNREWIHYNSDCMLFDMLNQIINGLMENEWGKDWKNKNKEICREFEINFGDFCDTVNCISTTLEF